MKFVVKKEILLDSLNNTSKAISTKNLIPILTGIKFDSKEDGLYSFKKAFYRGEPKTYCIGKKIFNEEIYKRLLELSDDIQDHTYFPEYRG